MLTVSRQFPRSVSAYENTICEDAWSDTEDDPTPSTFCESIAETEPADVKTETLEISLPRDPDQPNGMAFRMVGSRSCGIFIDYIQPGSSQNGPLREGDRLLRCNKISLRAVSVDQAASIFRFWMSRTSSLILLIERREDGEGVMLKRRRQTRMSMRNELREQTGHVGAGRATLRLTSSKSAEVFRSHNEPMTSSFEMKFPQYESFDTAQNNAKHLCPHCNTHTRMLYLHQFSHGFVHNAFRFLTTSRSSYSLL